MDYDEFWDAAMESNSPENLDNVTCFRNFLNFPQCSAADAIRLCLFFWDSSRLWDSNGEYLRMVESILKSFDGAFSPRDLRCELVSRHSSVNIFHLIFYVYGRAFSGGRSINNVWTELTQNAVAAQVDIHSGGHIYKEGAVHLTPLGGFFNAIWCETCLRYPWSSLETKTERHRFDHSLRSLVAHLSRNGVDIVAFGEFENRILKHTGNAHRFSTWGIRSGLSSWMDDILCITYGAQPSYWHIEYRSHPYDFAKHLWHQVESCMSVYDLVVHIEGIQKDYRDFKRNSSSAIPGEWIDSLEDEFEKRSYCEFEDDLMEMSLDEYTDLVRLVQQFDIGSLSNGESQEWWIAGSFVQCFSADMGRCDICLSYTNHLKRERSL